MMILEVLVDKRPTEEFFQNVGILEPPLLGKNFPIVKDTDPEDTRPQLTPFFSSKQFMLWDPADLLGYNTLIDALMKWRDRGWAEFTEDKEWVPEERNWISWVKWYTIMQVPADEIVSRLNKVILHPDIELDLTENNHE